MGAEQLYQAFRGSGLTLEEFEGPRYQRIGHIKMLLANHILDSELRHAQPASDKTDESPVASALSATE